MMCRSVIFSLLLLSSFTTYSQRFNAAKLDTLINNAERYNKIMGALTISKKGKVLYNRAWGYRTINEREQLKTNTDTKFRIGSISKMFTAVMILQLTEEGKLKLSNSLAAYFPTLPNAANITVEQLLNHHSGLYNFTDSTYLTYHTQPKTKAEMLTMLEQQTPSFDPGTNAAYSNTNFVLLGYIIEQITGESYAGNLKNRITSKIGLKNTYYGGAPESSKNEASSFHYNAKGWEAEANTDMSIPGGAGAIVSTTNDLVRFAEALFGQKLIKKQSLDKMIDLKDNFGLGIFQFPFDEKYAYGHTGGIDEFHAMLGYFPQDSITFAFTGNGQTIEMNDLAIGILSICFDRHYEIPDYSIEDYTLAAEQMAKYEGLYSSKQLPLKIVIKRDGDKLTAQASGQRAFPLTPVNESLFKFDAAKLRMEFDVSDKKDIRQFTLKQSGGSFIFTKE